MDRTFRKRRRPWRQALIEIAAGAVIACTLDLTQFFEKPISEWFVQNLDYFQMLALFLIVPAYIINSQRIRRRDFIRIHGDQVTWRIDRKRPRTAPIDQCKALGVDLKTGAYTFATPSGKLTVTPDFEDAFLIGQALCQSPLTRSTGADTRLPQFKCDFDFKRLLLFAFPLYISANSSLSSIYDPLLYIIALLACTEPYFCKIIVKDRKIELRSRLRRSWSIRFDDITGAVQRDYSVFGNPVIDTTHGPVFLNSSLANADHLIAFAQAIAEENRSLLAPSSPAVENKPVYQTT